MAQEDLDNMPVAKTDEPRTAYDNIGDVNESPNDVENRAAAEAAGVKHAAYIGYEDALLDYEARPDIEDLAHKAARNGVAPDAAATFADGAFMREVGDQTGSSGV
jgi:hypothetical protein